jgi:hypothetical protein
MFNMKLCSAHRQTIEYLIPTLHCFHLFLLQDYSKDAVAHVQKFLMKNEVPVNLFEVSIN